MNFSRQLCSLQSTVYTLRLLLPQSIEHSATLKQPTVIKDFIKDSKVPLCHVDQHFH